MEKRVIIKEIAEYLHNGFKILQEYGSYEKTESFVERSLDRIVYVRRDGVLVGAAAYMLIEDETLAKIKSGEIDLQNYETFQAVEKENGNNIHIFALRAEGARVILKALKDIIRVKKPKTVSWLNPDMKLKIVRGNR